MKKEAESQKDENQECFSRWSDAERDNANIYVNGKAFNYMVHLYSIQNHGKPYKNILVSMLEFDCKLFHIW